MATRLAARAIPFRIVCRDWLEGRENDSRDSGERGKWGFSRARRIRVERRVGFEANMFGVAAAMM